jgi:hypothetical protein
MLRQRQPRVEDPGFLAFVRTFPCINCGKAPPSQAAHIRMACPDRGKRHTGMQEKPDDRWVIPLCQECHLDGPRALHKIGEEKFFVGWDPFAEAVRLFLAFRGLNPDVVEDHPVRRKSTKRRQSRPRPPTPWRWSKRPMRSGNRLPRKGQRKFNRRRKNERSS